MSTEQSSDVQDAARALLERQMQDRLAVIDRLIESQAAEKQLDHQLAVIRQQWHGEWAEALRLGWSEQDLRKLKLRTPPDLTGKPMRRARGARGAAARSSTGDASSPTVDGSGPSAPPAVDLAAGPPATPRPASFT
ncbi:hypothetical protein GCM10009727_51810 [Actinomadura napierensis]|uniref:Uncharacterized protein n=1 Tax=Actinomadura napierensis TaxID=267854 RepID=A0ABP5LK65_9ACTN